MPTPRKSSPRTPRSRTPQATAAALQEAARYREFFENANDALALFTTEGKIALVNRAAEHLLGYTRKELLGQHYRKVVTAAAAEEAVERSRKALAQEPLPSTFTTDLVRKDGSVVRVEARDRLVWDAAGTLAGFQGIYRDITERTRAEQSLRESETRYRNVSESISDYAFSFAVVNGDLRLEWLTASFTTITGYAVDDVRQSPNPLAVYVHPDDLPRIVELIRTLPPEQPTTYEFRIRTKDGRERWIQSTARALHDPNGQLSRLYGAARDVTEQKQRDEEMLESRRVRDRMAETIPDIVYTYDLEQKAFVYVNRQVFTLLGYRPEQVMSQTDALFRDRVHGADRERVQERDARVAQAADEEVITTELRLKHARGEWRSLRFRESVALRTETGAPRQIVGTAQDITERKWLEDLLRERVLDRTELPTRLKEFRTGLRLSQAQFGAQFGGYNQPQISSYEGGDSAIPLGLLLAIRDKGYPVEAVLGGGSRDVVSQTATYLPAQHHKKLLVRELLASALRLVTEECQTAEELLQGLGLETKDFVGEPDKDLAQVLQALDKRG